MKRIHLISIVLTFYLNINLGQIPTFTNPILRGGYPDPSICRVGNDYYMANSSFEYFPGIPIHHSTDLVLWELIGHGLHRKEQCKDAINLMDVQSDGGIHAPTLRYHDSTFYLITTNVYQPPNSKEPTQFVNFILTAKNPSGPWSNPIVVKGAPGIDPDIFFDEDNRIWYTGTHAPKDPNFSGEGEIWMQELDPKTFQLIGKRHFLWRGACQGTWAEGPHIYKKDGWYYLLIAEGGTGFNHAVMIATSKNITGPYVPNDRNPILTSRHLSYNYWVNSTGHADMVEMPNGVWKMVCLGIRNEVNHLSNMGRETLFVPVIWEKEPYEWKTPKYTWPVCSPDFGRVGKHVGFPLPLNQEFDPLYFEDEFYEKTLNIHWTYRRVKKENSYDLNAQNGYLHLNCLKESIGDRKRYNFTGIKQRETNFELVTIMQFNPTKNGEEAGLCLMQKDNNYILFDVKKEDNQNVLQLVINPHDKNAYIQKDWVIDNYNGYIELKVIAKANKYEYYYRFQSNNLWVLFDESPNDWILARRYTGAHLGLYATSNGVPSENHAAFDLFKYTDIRK
jgi:xylan 1,4-beta-xylosidase